MKRSTLGIRRSKIEGRPKLDLEVCRKHHSRPMGRVGFVFCSLISVSIEILKKYYYYVHTISLTSVSYASV